MSEENQTELTLEETDNDVQEPRSESIPKAQLMSIIEAILFANDEPMSLKQLQKALMHPEYALPTVNEIKVAIAELQTLYMDRGIELQTIASGYRFQIKAEYGRWVSQLWDEKPPRYSRALLETLVLVAYRQPITRAEIEEVRGVAVSSHIMKTLSEQGWIKVVGHRDVPGRPGLYATTKAFLDYFNLLSLDALPTLEAVRDLESIAAELGDEFTKALTDVSDDQQDDQDDQNEPENSSETSNPDVGSDDQRAEQDDLIMDEL